jgi:hypothetical protein
MVCWEREGRGWEVEARAKAQKPQHGRAATKKTESWLDRIMQGEEKPEPMRMILSSHDSVFGSYCGPADFLAACEQLWLLRCTGQGNSKSRICRSTAFGLACFASFA